MNLLSELRDFQVFKKSENTTPGTTSVPTSPVTPGTNPVQPAQLPAQDPTQNPAQPSQENVQDIQQQQQILDEQKKSLEHQQQSLSQQQQSVQQQQTMVQQMRQSDLVYPAFKSETIGANSFSNVDTSQMSVSDDTKFNEFSENSLKAPSISSSVLVDIGRNLEHNLSYSQLEKLVNKIVKIALDQEEAEELLKTILQKGRMQLIKCSSKKLLTEKESSFLKQALFS